MKVAFLTLGCKVNQYETEAVRELFIRDGFEPASPGEDADVFLINSCTVTSTGDKKTRQAIRRLRRENPNACIALMGCFPQAFPDDAEVLTEADVVTGTHNRTAVVAAAKEFLITKRRIVSITPHERGEHFEHLHTTAFSEHTRAFVKIEDGCDRYCSYCIIPAARGPVRSKSLQDIAEECKALCAVGHKELVLVGINLSSYGKDIGCRLIDAVRIACDTDGAARVRLGSLEPELLPDEDIAALSALPKFCPQFHLSLQSGCDATLRRMNRHYTADEYALIVDKLRMAFPDCAITTDIMVGFPGETDEEFVQSLAFAGRIGFAKVHIFAYSKREGTVAARAGGQVSPTVKEERSRLMAAVTAASQEAFLVGQIGRVFPVLFEAGSPGWAEGFTPNYSSVRVKYSNNDKKNDLRRRILYVKIVAVEKEHCIGQIVDMLSYTDD